MGDSECFPVGSEASGLGWRRVLRNIAVECFARQPVAVKLWEMKYFRRLILGVLFRLETKTIVTVNAGPAGNRFRMCLRWQAHMAYVLGLYEREIIGVLEERLKTGDVCVDVGAHVGYLSMIMARLVGPQGRVISFEPVRETYEALKENIQLNGLNNVTIEPAAAGEADGFLELVCTKGEELSWTASATGYSLPGEGRRISVPVVSLDGYFAASALRPGLIKIDVEGAEAEVLRGARQTLRNIRPIVLVEIHDLGERHRKNVLELLEGCGYAVTGLGTREREILCLALPFKGKEGPAGGLETSLERNDH